ncbi:MAG: hypothetical protein JWM10_3571, partial [Myxococcaceae bacterium]|nr:hypothetical protein [Myxococcaceae bacterium]
ELTRDAGERALVAEAERAGVDPRTVERALFVDRGEASVVLAAGSFDARRIVDLHWERMLPPRRRGGAGTGRERVEGSLGERPVAVAVDAVCGLLARSERDGRLVDPVLDRPAGGEAEPAELIRWHIEGAPEELDDTTTAALTASLRWTELRADAVAEGVRVTLVLAGPLPANTPARMTRLLDAVSLSPMGGAVGADDWLHAEAATWSHEGETWRGALVIPWRGLRALVSLARGTVGSPTRQEL